MKRTAIFLISKCGLVIVSGFFLWGCATTVKQAAKPSFVLTNQGTAVYKEKYEFKAPTHWRILQADSGSDFEFGFLRFEGDFPNQTTFVFDDQPYGSSQDLEKRAKQYETLFFMNTGLTKTSSKVEKAEVMGQPAVILQVEGQNPQGEKARSKIYLVKRGEWIVSFLCTQWRSMNEEFDPQDFEIFDTFAHSFKYLKPGPFEDIIHRIKNLKG
jgi:hypothetical protein